MKKLFKKYINKRQEGIVYKDFVDEIKLTFDLRMK